MLYVGGDKMIEFHSGIIKGKIIHGKLEILDERILPNHETHIVSLEAIEEFLEKHDFRHNYNKKTGTYTFTKNFIGNNLEEVLRIKKVSKSELARRIGSHRTHVWELCRTKNLELETIYKILSALDMQPNDIDIVFPIKNKHLIEF